MTLRGLLVLALVAGCGQRRAYPLMGFHPVQGRERLELGAATLLDSGLVVAMSEKDPTRIHEVAPVLDEHGGVRSLAPRGRDAVDLFDLRDPSQACGEPRDTRRWHRCRNRDYRALVPLVPRAITWLPSPVSGRVVEPFHVEDLAAFGPDRVLGVTEFSTIGRITGFRADKVSPAREASERLFVLERGDDGWHEVRVPEIERLRQALSDWGRATCDQDLVVEGLAFDPGERVVYVGINRCLGPAQRVLGWDLGAAEAGGAVSLETVVQALDDAYPSEGISSLDFARGRLWATTSWDDWGFEHEPVYGARLFEVVGDGLERVPTASLEDRADALVVLPAAGDEDVSALLMFDNDFRSPRRVGLNGTLVHAVTPRPADGRYAELLSLEPSPFGDRPLGLNGFDFHWRDHRVGQVSVVADRTPEGPGAWTSALGGAWQARLGALGLATRPVLGKAVGHDRHAVGVTDYLPVPELAFTAYKAVLTIVPRERTGDERSIAQLLPEVADDYDVIGTLPEAAAEGAGLVLQGFAIDTSPRATGGVCMVAVDLGVDWASAARDAVRLRGMLLGGLCNDFNTRTAEEHHGLTTDPEAGVRVTLYFAVVEGAEASRASVVVAERDRAGRRRAPTSLALVEEGGLLPDRAAYRLPGAPERVGSAASKAQLACFRVDPAGRAFEARGGPESDAEWLAIPEGRWPQGGAGPGRAGSLSGFALALDLRGFDPGYRGAEYAPVGELEARNQNAYFYRWLVGVWPDPEGGLFVEGGVTHGLHRGGFGRDGSLPTAHLLRADVTWWDDLSAAPVAAGMPHEAPRRDPNLQPEDGFVRWAYTAPRRPEGPMCSPR